MTSDIFLSRLCKTAQTWETPWRALNLLVKAVLEFMNQIFFLTQPWQFNHHRNLVLVISSLAYAPRHLKSLLLFRHSAKSSIAQEERLVASPATCESSEVSRTWHRRCYPHTLNGGLIWCLRRSLSLSIGFSILCHQMLYLLAHFHVSIDWLRNVGEM